MSRHGTARVLRRPRWSSAVAVAGIAALVALGASFAVWHPIDTPAVASSAEPSPAAAAAAPVPEEAITATTSDPAPPSSEAAVTTGPSAAPPAIPVASAPPPAALTSTAAARAAAIASGQPCRPVRFSVAPLHIDAPVVTLSLTSEGDLGTPSDADRKSAGWFPSVLAGADQGTVLMDGHTYHDGSAIFATTFKQQVQPGMLMRLSCADGHAFSYRVAEVVVDLSPAGYPHFVTSRHLYAADGPPQLVMVTCTDYLPAQRVWANRAVVIATPMA
jgi:hypothetical protein